MAMKRLDLEFTKKGDVFNAAQLEALLNGLDGVTDLIVASHGWNNDLADARKLYDELLGNVDTLLDARDKDTAPKTLVDLRGRVFAACQVFWPSKKFTDDELIPGGGVSTATGDNDTALIAALKALAEDPEQLGGKAVSQARLAIADKAVALVPQLETDQGARRDFLELLRSLLNKDHASSDDASDEFFSENPEVLFKNMAVEVPTMVPAGTGGATTVGAGGAAGLGDFLKGMKAAARRLANFATYYQMKERAGTVGSKGLAAVLQKVRARNANIRLHLVGHSFGGRLVTAAAQTLAPNTQNVSVSLLQAAFSHNALSADFDSGKAGFYRSVVGDKRVSGPIVITHTKADTAVGIAYPLASRIARQNASALGDANDPYGGMGRNGAQRTAEVHGSTGKLEAVGHEYGFARGKIYNLLADGVIKDHGDVRSVSVAYAILAVAAAS